ncbi:MAG: LPS-assembly protein LptD [Proteobacteria bacterium]|nr:LPS-assembly protein LptD [Pseudomonadota bacterium]
MKFSHSADARARSAWLAGAAAAVLAGAVAQPGAAAAAPSPEASLPATPPAPPVVAPPAPDDGLAGGGFYLEADELTQDNTTHRYTATGNVEARYNGRTLRARSLEYDSNTGVVTARGDVQILNPDGTAEFSDAVTLDKDMSAGVALGFSTRLQGGVKIAAASATRHSEDVTELRDAIYTPCAVCADGGRKEPTWSIRASQVVEDKKRQLVTYHHAVVQVLGVGVLYLPVLWTADPSAERKSGFLTPYATYSQKRGVSYAQSWYQVISPSQDITITPQINTTVNPFLTVDWRRRFYSGSVDVRAGYTYERDFDSHGNKFGSLTSRSYILAKGAFDIDQHWRWGFTAERASEPLIFDKYDVSNVFVERGLYAADDRRLVSQLYVTRQDPLSYFSAAAISVQGLRQDDINSTFPLIAPVIEARWELPQALLGGRLRVDGSAVVLDRNRSPTDPLQEGVDSRRATVQANWRGAFTFANGLRVEPFLQARADVYSVANLPAPYASTATIGRGLVTGGADISYPLIKQAGDVTWILEPLAQIALSPNNKLDPRIPNEDSQVWELDETNLFQVNRSPGYDLYESGQRFTVGGRATAFWTNGRSASVMLGRSFRANSDPALPANTSLDTQSSDYVLGAEVTPVRGVHLFSRWRLGADNGAIHRLEAGGDFTTTRVSGYIRYLEEVQAPTGGAFKGLDFRGDLWATKHWGLSLYGIRNFDTDQWLRRDIGVVYRDDCVRVEVIYRSDETTNGTLGPSKSVVLRLTLATLGNSGYRP